MTRYYIEPSAKNYVKGCRFLPFARNVSNKYGKLLLDTVTKTGLDALRTTSKKVAHKAAEATGEFIENKIADKTVKPKPVTDDISRRVTEITFPPEKKEEVPNELRQVL